MRLTSAQITASIREAAECARREIQAEAEPPLVGRVQWPVPCTVGPGLEGAIACESSIGYVNGSQGWLLYRGYDIFDLAAHSTFEEVCYLLLHGALPTAAQFDAFNRKLLEYRRLPITLRRMMGFPVEQMPPMEALRMGTNLMRLESAPVRAGGEDDAHRRMIGSDEDSIAMETPPRGHEHAVYEFNAPPGQSPSAAPEADVAPNADLDACYRLIAGVATIAAATARLRRGCLPLEPDPELGHAANYLYMMTGRRPTVAEARVLDISLILHADHGMNASTFASMVVASTLSDIYFAVGAGIGALNGPLHGGANERVIHMLEDIGNPRGVHAWYETSRQHGRRIMGFGHRVYKAYDPRARVLKPLARRMARTNPDTWRLYRTAEALEKKVIATLGQTKKVFPNVDFYSGIVYAALGIPRDMFTPIFAVSRVSGWTARVMEYMGHNRIFRPRAVYTGPIGLKYAPVGERKE